MKIYINFLYPFIIYFSQRITSFYVNNDEKDKHEADEAF